MSQAPRKHSLFPKTLGQCVEPLTRPVLKTQGLAGSRIVQEWSSIAGNTLARHCNPHKLSFPQGKKTNGTLTIAVEAGFSLQIQHMEPVILERLVLYFGYKAVTRIMISAGFAPIVLPLVLSSSKRTLPAGCLQLIDTVDDPELKAALSAFGHTLLPTSI